MQTGWLAKAGPIRIERIPGIPHPDEDVQLSAPAVGVIHTTEGGWDSAMSVFRRHYAPHFLVGPGRIAQLIPLGKMAAALEHPPGFPESNRVARVQVEVVGYSKSSPYRFDVRTEDALAALMGALVKAANIPLVRPFPDNMPPLPWATRSFKRRLAGKWGRVAGWFGHVEVPGNSHWDPGALQWAPLVEKAKVIAAPPKPRLKWSYRVVEKDDTITTGKTNFPRLSIIKQVLRNPKSFSYERLF